jgi:uridine kinase
VPKLSAIEPLITEITRRMQEASPFVVALDGRSGAGKSTLAAALARRLDALVIVQDDFYTGGSFADWSGLSAREKADRVIDWRRLRRDALEPLRQSEPARWRTFNWATYEGLSDNFVVAQPAPVIVLDGAYSARPELADLIDCTVLVVLDDATRRERIRQREGADFADAWHAVWDEAEAYYFTHVRPLDAFDIVLTLPASDDDASQT